MTEILDDIALGVACRTASSTDIAEFRSRRLDLVHTVLSDALERHGMHEHPELFRLSGQAMFRVGPYGAKVYTAPGDVGEVHALATRSTRLAKVLADRGIAVGPAPEMPEVICTDKGAVTFTRWEEVTGPGSWDDVEELLRRLDSVPVSAAVDVGVLKMDVIHDVTTRRLNELATAGVVSSSTANRLLNLHQSLGKRVERAVNPTRPVIVHGDAVPHNVLRTSSGPRLIDFDLACLASRHFEAVSQVPLDATVESVRESPQAQQLRNRSGIDVAEWDDLAAVLTYRQIAFTTFFAWRSIGEDLSPEMRQMTGHLLTQLEARSVESSAEFGRQQF